ncbi:MAG: pyridoxamine 5'-phosphate oxidase [Methyloceanibacter sp.]
MSDQTRDDFTEAPDPFPLFRAWMAEAEAAEPADPEAMAVATADASGLPNVRMVLLKGADERGFVFYTNSESAKGEELAANPQAALLFYWKSLGRQIRIRGPVEPASEAEADAYFATRHRASQIGACASRQSRPLKSRAALVAEVARLTASFGVGKVPRPAHWHGYRVIPLEIEFWQNGPFRLHDRIVFRRADAKAPWTKTRLYP